MHVLVETATHERHHRHQNHHRHRHRHHHHRVVITAVCLLLLLLSVAVFLRMHAFGTRTTLCFLIAPLISSASAACSIHGNFLAVS